MTAPGVDESRLDDAKALAAVDSHDMLRAVASSAAQLRRGATAATDAGLDRLAADDRPRALVVTGMGGSGIAGDVVAAVAGMSCPVPVVVHRGYGLPGWVGAADTVVAVSCSGGTQETLSAVDEAIRRGARVVGIGAAESPLAARCEQARAPLVAVTATLCPRASLWTLATPALVAAARLGLVDLGPDDAQLEAAAVRLETVAEACRPDHESFVNPAKLLAVELLDTLPMVWGVGAVGGVAAVRAGAQLAENAKYPAVVGVVPEAHHNQVVTFDGPLAGAGVSAADDDLFRDRVDDATSMRQRLVLVRDDDGSPTTRSRADASAQLAEARGIPVSVVRSAGDCALERLASLVGLVDYASVYLAVALGVDPTPIVAIDQLKARLA